MSYDNDSSSHPFLCSPAAPLLFHCDREAARPTQPEIPTDGVRVFYDAGSGFEGLLVLPLVDMAVEI